MLVSNIRALAVSRENRTGKASDTDVQNPRGQGLIFWQDGLDFS